MDEGTVRALAGRCGWQEVQHNTQSRVMGFVQDGMRVNVYYTTGTVGTCLDHPRQGKTQLFRRGCTLDGLREIFENPRVHTGAGYYRRHSAPRPEPTQERGPDICSKLAHQEAHELLRSDWSDRTVTLALGRGFFAVNANGSTWWSGIPRELYNKCNGRQRSLPPVDYVALGPNESYFVQFADGKQQWWAAEGLDELSETLHNSHQSVELLAFAPGGGYYIMWEDGTHEWWGLPRGLENQLRGRSRSLPGVEFLSVGPNGEWFVRYLDGSWRGGGWPTACQESVDVHGEGGSVLKILFGEEFSWAVVYD